MTPSKDWTRVVILSPPPPAGRGLTDGLKKEFATRDWFAVEQHDPHLAMAEVCLRERAQVARSAWGLQRMELIALVVMQPKHWPDLNDLVQAVRQFVPSASIWSIGDDDVIEPLNGVSVSAAGIDSNNASGVSEQNMDDAVPDVWSVPSQLVQDDNPSAASAAKSQRITREEIDMLLEMESGMPAGEGRP